MERGEGEKLNPAVSFVIQLMRRWKVVGSISGRDDSVRSNKSRDDSPFQSFHYSLQNKSEHLPSKHEKSFCQEYMQRRKEYFRNVSFDNANSEKNLHQGNEDMFTSMRNILKDQSLQSRVSSKSLDSKVDTSDHKTKLNGKQLLQKTSSKIRSLKKQQSKLKHNLQKEVAAIKNIFYQLDEVLHTHNNRQEKEESHASAYDPEILKEILSDAVSVQKYFAEMDRKKNDIMNRLSNQ